MVTALRKYKGYRVVVSRIAPPNTAYLTYEKKLILTPKTAAQIKGVIMKTALKRAVRTFLQLVAGGGLTAFVTELAGGLDPDTTAIVLAGNTVVVTYVQNLLEDLGWVKPILK